MEWEAWEIFSHASFILICEVSKFLCFEKTLQLQRGGANAWRLLWELLWVV